MLTSLVAEINSKGVDYARASKLADLLHRGSLTISYPKLAKLDICCCVYESFLNVMFHKHTNFYHDVPKLVGLKEFRFQCCKEDPDDDSTLLIFRCSHRMIITSLYETPEEMPAKADYVSSVRFYVVCNHGVDVSYPRCCVTAKCKVDFNFSLQCDHDLTLSR